MGNYLQSLRVPSQTASEREHERHHPLYYDWSLPKWSPFRVELQARATATAAAAASDAAPSQGGNLVAESTATDRQHNKQGNKTQPPSATGSSGGGGGLTSSGGGKLAVAAKSAIKTTKEAIQKSLKSALTSTVDRADSKPINADKTSAAAAARKPSGGGGAGGKSTGSGTGNHKPATTREAAQAASSMRKSTHAATIKRVDSTRPQTIDPARNGGIDDQAALKAATNIHTVAGGSTSSTRKRVPAS